jgi:hypothetical protein
VIASDSGRIVIAAYNKEHNRFDKARAAQRAASAASVRAPCAFALAHTRTQRHRCAAAALSRLAVAPR